jgi:hypothetical protein
MPAAGLNDISTGKVQSLLTSTLMMETEVVFKTLVFDLAPMWLNA